MNSFVKIDRFMMRQPSWEAMSPSARCLYLELRYIFFGGNNGEIAMSCRLAAEKLHCSKNSVSRYFKELESHGYIKPHQKGKFKHRWASTWILTNESYNGIPATNEWLRWRPTSVPVKGLHSTRSVTNELTKTHLQ